MRTRLDKNTYNWFKVQHNIINEYNKCEKILYCKIDDYSTAISFKTYGMYIIPNRYLILDVTKFEESEMLLREYKRFMKEEEKVPVVSFNTIERDGGKLNKCTLENNIDVYYNAQYIKQFIINDIKNYELFGSTNISSLHIYYNGYLIGFLLPVVVKEESKKEQA